MLTLPTANSYSGSTTISGGITSQGRIVAGTASVSGNVLTLTWPADHIGWTLQCQTNTLGQGLTANSNAWFAVPGSAGNNANLITIDPGQPTVFYRLKLYLLRRRLH